MGFGPGTRLQGTALAIATAFEAGAADAGKPAPMHSRPTSRAVLAAVVTTAAGMAGATGPPPLPNAQAPPPSPEHTTVSEHFIWPLQRLFPSEFRDLAFPLPDAFPDWVDDFEAWASGIDGQNVDFSGLNCSSPLILEHFLAYVAALADLEPLTDYALSSAVYYFNLGLKQCKPLAIAPQPLDFELDEANDCELVIDDQRKHQDWNYIFFSFPPPPALSLEDGVTAGPATFGGTEPGTRIGIDPADTLWGPLGTPLFFH